MSNEIEKIGKQTPFTVPDGYFESLHDSISQAVDRENTKRRRTLMVKWTLSAAAAIAAIAIAGLAIFKSTSPAQVNNAPTMMAQNSDTMTQTTVTTATDQQQTAREIATIDSKEIQELPNDQLDELVALAECDEFINCSDNYDIY